MWARPAERAHLVAMVARDMLGEPARRGGRVGWPHLTGKHGSDTQGRNHQQDIHQQACRAPCQWRPSLEYRATDGSMDGSILQGMPAAP